MHRTETAPDGSFCVGRTMAIKGDLRLRQNLRIDGRIDGTIRIEANKLVIGVRGVASADVVARSVVVFGRLDGDVTASELVKIAPSGSVRGRIRAPRVSLAEGCSFCGTINEEPADDVRRALWTLAADAC